MTDLITIPEAAKQGISKLRAPHWANPRDHIEIHITRDGGIGPWVALWSEMNGPCGQDNPHKLLVTEFTPWKAEWLPYTPDIALREGS